MTGNGRPDEYGADEASKCSYDDEGQNLKPLPLMVKCDLKHDQLSVLKRVDSLQSHCSNNGAKERPPHSFRGKKRRHFFQREQHASNGSSKANAHACMQSALRKQKEESVDLPAAAAPESSSLFFPSFKKYLQEQKNENAKSVSILRWDARTLRTSATQG